MNVSPRFNAMRMVPLLLLFANAWFLGDWIRQGSYLAYVALVGLAAGVYGVQERAAREALESLRPRIASLEKYLRGLTDRETREGQ